MCSSDLFSGWKQSSPDPIGVPDCVRDEMLKALVGDRVGDTGQHRLHRFPIAVAEHAVHVRPQGEPLRTMAEAALKRFEPANQALHANGRRVIDHRAPAYPIHAIGTRSSPFTKTFRNTSPDLTKSY